jgi:hypothetical protein
MPLISLRGPKKTISKANQAKNYHPRMLKWKKKRYIHPAWLQLKQGPAQCRKMNFSWGPVLKNQARAACCWKLETKILTKVWVTTDNLKCAGPCRIHTLATLRVKKRVKVPLT